MKTVEFQRTPDQPAQIAFDRVARTIKRLFAEGYSVKQPFKTLREGYFAIETLPSQGGWKVTVNPLPGRESPVF